MSKIRYFHAHETARYDEVNGCPLAGFRPRMWAILIDLVIIEVLKSIFHLHGKQQAFNLGLRDIACADDGGFANRKHNC